jgi:hypothetical protein
MLPLLPRSVGITGSLMVLQVLPQPHGSTGSIGSPAVKPSAARAARPLPLLFFSFSCFRLAIPQQWHRPCDLCARRDTTTKTHSLWPATATLISKPSFLTGPTAASCRSDRLGRAIPIAKTTGKDPIGQREDAQSSRQQEPKRVEVEYDKS